MYGVALFSMIVNTQQNHRQRNAAVNFPRDKDLTDLDGLHLCIGLYRLSKF